MKTTVRDFILDNMTDSNFERLVNMLILESVFDPWNDELVDTISEYLNKKKSYTKNNTFEILNEIKKITHDYPYNYKGECLIVDELLYDVNATTLWMPTTNSSDDDSENMEFNISEVNPSMESLEASIIDNDELDPEPELEFNFYDKDLPIDLEPRKFKDSEYRSFNDLKIAFLSETYEDIEKNYININDLNTTNYQEYVFWGKNRIALGLSNFIYEILEYTTEYKLKNNFEQFSNESSHVKIEIDNQYEFGYCVHFLLDNRTRYISDSTHKAYYNYTGGYKIAIEPPKFVDYDELQESLSFEEGIYLLAPFTDYLNEELIVPNVSEDVLYGLLEQLIYILTHQGFTKEEQIKEIKYWNETYVKNLF